MPHNYNRTAFQAGMVAASPLLALYCSLVDLELALKNHFWAGGWRRGHKVIDWVADAGEAALSIHLENCLTALKCTAITGAVSTVAGNSYPDVRYLRHQSDFVGTSTDQELHLALQAVNDVRAALRARGVAV